MIIDDRQGQQNLLRQWSQPYTPEAPSFSAWSFAKSGVKGLPMAGLETAGSWTDLLSAYGTAEASMHGADWLSQGDPAARKQMLEKGSFDFTAGNQLRAKADEFAADPATSHQADVVINGLTRTVGKAVGYLGTMGPYAGAVAFGVDEGNTTAQRLMEKGVDPATAAKAGGVTGVVSAAGAMLPVGGRTALETAGLVAVGGPGLYMAQETLAKRILQDYPQEAAAHDPFDPLGLALSVAVPAVAGGLHMRGVAKKAKGEAAMKAEATLTPQEQAASDAFERSDANLRELRQAIDAEKNPESKKLLQAELDKQMKEAQAHAGEVVQRVARDPEAVDAARVRVQESRLQETLPDVPYARTELMRAVDSLGAGETPRVTPLPDFVLPEFKQWFEGSKVVDAEGRPLVMHHGTNKTQGDDAFTAFDTYSSEYGLFGQGGYFTADPEVAAQYTKKGDGTAPTIYPTYLSIKNPIDMDAKASPAAWAKAYPEADFTEFAPKGDTNEAYYRAVEESLAFDGVDRHEGQAIMQEGLRRMGHDGVTHIGGGRIDASGKPHRVFVAFDPEQIKSAIGNSGKFDPNSASLTDPLQPGEVSPRYRNLLPEAGEPLEPVAATAGDEAASQSAAVKALSEEVPDMRVSIPGHEAMSVAEALETAQAEAKDIRSFAELVKTAVQCALQMGAIA